MTELENILKSTEITQILEELEETGAVTKKIGKDGILNINKSIPFLVVYRIPPNGKDEFTEQLGKTESSYLVGNDETHEICATTIALADALSDKFKGFLILEIWMSPEVSGLPFTIYVSQKSAKETAVKLAEELNKIPLQNNIDNAEVKTTKTLAAPPYYAKMINIENANKSAITYIGLEIKQIYLDEETRNPFPLLVRNIRTHFSIALRKSFYEFIRTQTSYNATNFQMLGTTELKKVVYDIDNSLAHYSNQFDFLMLVTPINVTEAWDEFKKSKFSKNPVFHYRPLPIDPDLVKRALFNLPIEEVEDPTIAFLLRDKRKEIDHMLDMMAEREKKGFLLSSIQVFGNVDLELLETAKAILIAIKPVKKKKEAIIEKISALEFAQMAEDELQWLKLQDERVDTTVRVRDDVEGIMVSRGTLNINENFSVNKDRAFSLLQHEVGTHVVTYYNGKAQPLKLFYIGVPGYEELQEGLAVLAEYLTGGLTSSRMRTIAARVIAVDYMVKGKTFIDTFRLLMDRYHFTERSAFFITTRVYRGGGLTKDAVYLKGLLNVIKYIQEGKDLSQLLIGKIRQDYLPYVQELIYRKILNESPIKPRYLNSEFSKPIEKIKEGGSIFSMLDL